jgi:hypothetical protein
MNTVLLNLGRRFKIRLKNIPAKHNIPGTRYMPPARLINKIKAAWLDRSHLHRAFSYTKAQSMRGLMS